MINKQGKQKSQQTWANCPRLLLVWALLGSAETGRSSLWFGAREGASPWVLRSGSPEVSVPLGYWWEASAWAMISPGSRPSFSAQRGPGAHMGQGALDKRRVEGDPGLVLGRPKL